MSAELKELEPQLAEAEEQLAALLAATPNVPHESAPTGSPTRTRSRSDGTSEPTVFGFEPRDHAELGALLGVLDIERGAGRAARGSSTCWAISCSCSSRWCATRWTSWSRRASCR